MKISAQEKIAELEGRIVALEDQMRNLQSSTVCTKLASESVFGADWKAMWASFDRVMKKAFGENRSVQR